MDKPSINWCHLEVSINGGSPRSSIWIELSIMNQPAIGDPPFVEPPFWELLCWKSQEL